MLGNRLDIVGHLLIRKSTLAPAQWKKILRGERKKKKEKRQKGEEKRKKKSFCRYFLKKK
jgi:hypothetical protein